MVCRPRQSLVVPMSDSFVVIRCPINDSGSGMCWRCRRLIWTLAAMGGGFWIGLEFDQGIGSSDIVGSSARWRMINFIRLEFDQVIGLSDLVVSSARCVVSSARRRMMAAPGGAVFYLVSYIEVHHEVGKTQLTK